MVSRTDVPPGYWSMLSVDLFDFEMRIDEAR